jgi:hypothetical protein
MANEDWDVTRDCGRGEPRAARGDFLVELRGGPVAIYVGIDWRVFGRHEAIRSCGEVNDLIVWFLGEGLPSVDLAHGDLS